MTPKDTATTSPAGSGWRITPGHGAVMGPQAGPDGVNFAVFSAHATQIDLCLFDADGAELARLPLPRRDGDIWHGFVPGLRPGALYGLRAHGPYDPANGHRFNPNKLLIDPYTRALSGALIWDDAVYGYRVGHPAGDLSFDNRDSAPFVPKCVVPEPETAPQAPPRHLHPSRDSVIYEAHPKGLSACHPDLPEALRGTYAGIGSEVITTHLSRLGVTALELLPTHAFVDDRFLVDKGLRNYWGYQSIAFFAPASRYASSDDPVAEFREMAAALHGAGIELIQDVVYNHSGEGDELGPTLSFRGLDNRSYYHLADQGRYYVNHTGTGNALDLSHPAVLRLVLDSMRYWAGQMGVDGFRFDLASELLRGAEGFHPGSAFLAAVRQDPLLARKRLIAEPWDIGPDGYRLGGFPHPFHEWNDRYRDDIRRFWRGDAGAVPGLARRLLGSAELFDHAGRPATASVNFITCHDGFTLRDVVSYAGKHNLANGEQNRDGHGENYSDNLGEEGPTANPLVLAARNRRVRNMLATLMLSQGVPMLLAGDELGNSQGGNNNAYPQDNETGWVDWSANDPALAEFVARLTALRRDNPVLSQRVFLHGQTRHVDDLPDLDWRRADGHPPGDGDWHNPDWRLLCAVIRGSAENDEDATAREVFVAFNAGAADRVTLPPGAWLCALDTSRPTAPVTPAHGDVPIAAQSVLVFTRPD